MPDGAILIVCGGLLQVPTIEIAHGLGLKVVMTDGKSSCRGHVAR